MLKDEAELPYIPEDILEDYEIKARERIGKGYTFDLTSQSDMAEIVAAMTAE